MSYSPKYLNKFFVVLNFVHIVLSNRKKLFAIVFILMTAMPGCMESSQGEVNQEVLASLEGNEKILFKKYYSLGKPLYRANCANCHGKQGEGLGRVIPPLAKADYLKEQSDLLPCLLKYGLTGPVVVNGVEYNQAMPGFKALNPLEVTELITYIGNSWGNDLGLPSSKKVSAALTDCK